MQNNLPQFEPVLDCLYSTSGSDFLENCGLVVPNFLRFSSLCLHTSRAYFPTRKVRKLLSSRENGVWVGQVNIKEEFWIPVRVKFISMKQLTALKTATFPCSFSILSSTMCSSGNGTRSVRRNGKYRSIRHMKISEGKPEFLVEWNAPRIWFENSANAWGNHWILYHKTDKEASTVLCSVLKHLGSARALKKWGKTLLCVSCFPLHFFRALPLLYLLILCMHVILFL